jgi:glycopeptide antibiotics resistance protein
MVLSPIHIIAPFLSYVGNASNPHNCRVFCFFGYNIYVLRNPLFKFSVLDVATVMSAKLLVRHLANISFNQFL